MLGETNNQYQQNIGVVTNANGSQPVMQYENTYDSGSNVVESIVGAFGGLFNLTPIIPMKMRKQLFSGNWKKKKRVKDKLVIIQNTKQGNGEQRFCPHVGCGI